MHSDVRFDPLEQNQLRIENDDGGEIDILLALQDSKRHGEKTGAPASMTGDRPDLSQCCRLPATID